MRLNYWKSALAAGACAAALAASGVLGAEQAAPPPGQGAPGQAGRGGGRGGIGSGVFTAADANKDGSVTRQEWKALFENWLTGADTARSGAVTADQLAAGVNGGLFQGGGGRGSVQNQTPAPADMQEMMAALPDTAQAKPAKPRKVLVLAKAAGFVHSSIPLAARTVEALGTKTGAWATTITYDSADITAENLKQYDAIVLDNTTGAFLDDPNDAAATAARRKALLDFVRNGKGLAGIHAASDSYHAAGGSAGAVSGPAGALVQQIVSQGDRNSDKKLTKPEVDAVADAWFDKLDTAKAGKVSQQEFTTGFAAIVPAPAAPAAPAPQVGTWPEFNRLIGAFFKFHWNDPQHIFVKIDDPKSPLNAPFDYKPFEINDETYTYAQDSFSRDNCHVLTSVDYSKMSDEDKAKEPAATKRTDGDYALSWIRREGNGRVFYEAHGHSERVYKIKPMLGHYLAGIQYAIGDLKADDAPGSRGTR
jgi:type 1 glutamine amidotransferase